MPCWKSVAECPPIPRANARPGAGRWRRLTAVALTCAIACAGAAAADGVEVRDASLYVDASGYRLDAQFGIELPPEIEDLVARGIAVHFALDFEIIRERRYWFDRSVAERHQDFRLTYHPITRSYRVSSGMLQQGFDTLDEALRSIARVRGWAVADPTAMNPNKEYRASLRLSLDRSLLPKPFQLQVFATDAWTLDSGEYRWTFQAGELPRAEP